MYLYDELVSIGVPIEHHASDMYVLATPEAIAIIKKSGYRHHFFTSEVDQKQWIEVPFGYMPWWQARCKTGDGNA